MNITKLNQVKYDQAKKKSEEIIKLFEEIKCDKCEECPLNKHYGCSRDDLIGYLKGEFSQNQ